MIRKLFTIQTLILTLSTSRLMAQQLPIYSQYMMNEFLLNPAVAGADGRTAINLTGRKQWIGFSHPPETYSFSAQSRILKKRFSITKGAVSKSTKGRVGVGANIFSDKNGAINRTGMQLTYSYHIFVNNNSAQLSFGLTASTYQFKIGDEAQFRDADDPLQQYIGKSAIIPDASAGISYMANRVHCGISVSQLFQSAFKIGEISFNSNEVSLLRHYYIFGRYRYTVPRNPKWELEPSILVLTNENLTFHSDLSLRFIHDLTYWGGLSVRTSGEFVVLLGMKFNRIYVGYSFDYGFGGISRFTYGSHEISLSAKFGDSTRRYRWLERY